MLDLIHGIDSVGIWTNRPWGSTWKLEHDDVDRACAHLQKSRTWLLMTTAVLAALLHDPALPEIQTALTIYVAVMTGIYELMVHRIKGLDCDKGVTVYIVGWWGAYSPFGRPARGRKKIPFIAYKLFGLLLTYVSENK